MRFPTLLRPDLILLGAPWRTFPDTIAGMLRALVAAGELPAEVEPVALQAVIDREREASTALLDIRVGVPHARLAGLHGPVSVVAISPAGLYEPVPTVAIQIVALVLSAPEATTAHLETLAEIATLLRSPDLRATLLAARGGRDALAALQRHARGMP